MLPSKNSVIKLLNGGSITIQGELGRGGQGVVYKVVNEHGEEFALKWYFEQTLALSPDCEAFYKNLEYLAQKGAPDNRFLWPIDVTQKASDGCFGYIMSLRPDGYHEMGSFIDLRVRFESELAMYRACENVSLAFKHLHRKGLSYQDLNHGGIFIRPDTGDVLVCDNDNVAPDGSSTTNIKGFPGYMAPEVVLDLKRPWCGTDYHSLSVVLFYLTMFGHPLEGGYERSIPALTPKMSRMLYGSEALFIFDKVNANNRPIPGVHRPPIAMWPKHPDSLKEMFCMAFSREALHCNPNQAAGIRPMPRDWAKLFGNIIASLVSCPHCGKTEFIGAVGTTKCPGCGSERTVRGMIKAPYGDIPITEGAVLRKCMLNEDGTSVKVGSVVAKPGDPSVLGLKNETGAAWKVTSSGSVVEPGRSVVLSAKGAVNVGCTIEISLQEDDSEHSTISVR